MKMSWRLIGGIQMQAKRPERLSVLLFGGLLTLALFAWFAMRLVQRRAKVSMAGVASVEPEAAVFARYAGSQTCLGCHREEFNAWKDSHHARAERPLDPRLDGPGYDP